MLPLSFIAEYEYCQRSAYWLITKAPRLRSENVFIQDGRDAHKIVDEPYVRYKKNSRIESSVQIFSKKYGISGKIDVLEFVKNEKGEDVEIIPVEFKRGKSRISSMHQMQLALSALCLQEMFPEILVEKSAVFFTEDQQKKEIILTDELLEKARKLSLLLKNSEISPKKFSMKKDKRCEGCCFKPLCY